MKTKLSMHICAALLLCATVIQAQNFHNRQVSSLDIYTGADVGLTLIEELDENEETAMQNRTSETFNYSYKFGIAYNFGISKNLAIKTGVRFSNPGYSILRSEKIDFDEGINNITKRKSRDGYTYRVQHNLISIPVGVKYILSRRSACIPYLELGVLPSAYIETTVNELDIEQQSRKTTIKENINEFILMSFFSLGGNFALSDNVFGFTQLSGTYQLNNLRKESINEKLVTLGVEFGIRTHF